MKKFLLSLGGLMVVFMALIGGLPILVLTLVVGGGNDGEGMEGFLQYNVEGTAQVSEQVERYRPYFEKYTSKYGIEDHADILMAMTMQESGGRLPDVMQSSESLGLPRNTITDPEQSIEQGVKYFADVLDQAGGDTLLALQTYNMGHGYIDYVDEHNNGEYSQESAFDFGEMMADRMGWGNYGDENYIDNVMRYVDGFNEEPAEYVEGSGEWVLPLRDINVTSEYGMRHHPIHNEARWHGGIDFGCSTTDPVFAVADGVVVQANHQATGYGNHVTVQHGSNEYSLSAHLTSISVSQGDEVQQGEEIGICGTTGDSTGPHLHLEHITELGQPHAEKENPREILGL
uniref:lysozyme family protein n=1 Tax=Bacillaceae bacterium JMAK1 TaxID=1028381 RepID=UPI0003AC1342|nr:lysozyme family protein [Bacillaceae bacterium JMAK1]AGQ45430.1 Peptidase family protein [Bacillaceae bacterium JMAK1]